MLIPIGTDSHIYHWPFATGAIIVVNILVFVLQGVVGESYQWSSSADDPVAAAVIQDLPIQDRGNDGPGNGRGGRDEWDFEFEEIEPDENKFRDIVDELERQDFLDNRRKGWQPFALWLGDGLHPIQWCTCFFMHLDIMHLIGNMVFLALFGFIIEGRMGNWQFASYYLTMGVAAAFVTQLITLGAGNNGVALGASGAIYGLMATAMLWTPRVNVNCFVILFLFVWFVVRVPLAILVVVYVLLDITSVVFGRHLIDTGFLHVVGAMVGVVTATIVVRQGYVETENEDFFSIIGELMGKDPRKKKKKLTPAQVAKLDEERKAKETAKRFRLEQIWRSVDAHLDANNLDAAIMMERQARQMDSTSTWDEPRLLKLIGKLQLKKKWDQVVFYSELYLRQFQSRSITIQLNLAKILLLQKHSPRKALNVVRPLQEVELNPEQENTFKQIVLKSRQMIDAGTLELGD